MLPVNQTVRLSLLVPNQISNQLLGREAVAFLMLIFFSILHNADYSHNNTDDCNNNANNADYAWHRKRHGLLDIEALKYFMDSNY